MDELSALPPENWKTSPRQRRHDSPSTVRTDRSEWRASNNHQQRPLGVSTAAAIQSEIPLIFAPIPRRHLIENSASQHWLHNTSHSPLSSRSSSPLWQTPRQPHPSGSNSHEVPGSVYSQPHRTGPLPHSPTPSVSFHKTSPSNILRRRRLSSSVSKQNRLTELPGRDSQNFGTYPASPNLRGNGEYEYGSSRVATGGLKVYAEPEEPAMGRRWIRWMHRRGMKHCVIPGILGASIIVKLMIGLGSYSGHGTPPLYGDYEAQRHWMEITRHLPVKQWYTYDLQYWGLDYPPLTAYVSWLCGVMAHLINPSWVALDTSRGIETTESKVFLRLSVVMFDWLAYIPSLLLFIWTWQPHRSKRTQHRSLLTLIFQPSLLLIDFGHFQYNSVMLGLTLLAMDFFAMGEDAIGAFCFVLSLGFKQMALYYAPAIGSYLLAKCLYLGTVKGSRLFLQLAIVTLSTFILLFLPWLPPFASSSAILKPIIRIFPFSRGLFEDKVANFWCASNVLVKWKTKASPSNLVKLSTLLTALGFFPSVATLLRAGIMTAPPATTVNNEVAPEGALQKPGLSSEIPTFLRLLPYALLTSSMSFFLFSFQVHEKTILLPLMPMTLLLTNANFDSPEYHWGLLFNNVSVFSMWPLLKRDHLEVQYVATLILWNRLLGFNPFRLRPKSFIEVVSMGVYAAAGTLHILELLLKPPSRYPDLYPVLNVLISTPVFILVWLWSIKSSIEKQWALGGLGLNTSNLSATTTPPGNSEDATSLSGDALPHVKS